VGFKVSAILSRTGQRKEKSGEERKGRTNGHSVFVIGKQYRHEAEEVLVVLVTEEDGFDGDVVEDGLDGVKLAFDSPGL
jgi:hypothetical protein